jgi:hypothetical protein
LASIKSGVAAVQDFDQAYDRLGQIQLLPRRTIVDRFTPVNGRFPMLYARLRGITLAQMENVGFQFLSLRQIIVFAGLMFLSSPGVRIGPVIPRLCDGIVV